MSTLRIISASLPTCELGFLLFFLRVIAIFDPYKKIDAHYGDDRDDAGRTPDVCNKDVEKLLD